MTRSFSCASVRRWLPLPEILSTNPDAFNSTRILDSSFMHASLKCRDRSFSPLVAFTAMMQSPILVNERSLVISRVVGCVAVMFG